MLCHNFSGISLSDRAEELRQMRTEEIMGSVRQIFSKDISKRIGGRFGRILAGILSAALLLSSFPLEASAEAWNGEDGAKKLAVRFWKDEKPGVRFYINAAAKYILEDQEKQSEISGEELPKVGTNYGEWSVWDLLRGMYTGLDYINEIPEGYFEGYLGRVESYVEERKGILSSAKSTEWSRLMLPLTALQYDIRNVAGYDFIHKLSQSFKFSYRQGINGPIWELIAMNGGGYTFDESDQPEDQNAFGKMLDYIAKREITDADGNVGGWALTGKKPDPDITGMALTALAPYYRDEARYQETGAAMSYEEFAAMVERGILTISTMQSETGGFASWGTSNSESIVWSMIPLLELGIDPMSEKETELLHIGKTCCFVKEGGEQDGVWTNNMVDALLTFWADGSGSSPTVGGFKHVTTGYDGGGGSGTAVNPMATDQALYGLIAYDRFLNGQTSLMDHTDMQEVFYGDMKAASYTITYDGNGGACQNRTVTASPYAEVLLPADIESHLASWNTEPDGSGSSYYPGELLCMPEENITLYAQYGRSEFTLTLEMNGGRLAEGVTVPTVYHPQDEEILLPSGEEMVREGCSFGGWYADPELKGTAVTGIPKGSYGDKVFYAKWNVKSDKANRFIAIVNELYQHDLTIADRTLIQEGRDLYEAMYPIERERIPVSTYNRFLAKEEALKELQLSLDRISTVQSLIAALEKEITLADESNIREAREAYDGLTAEEQSQITNLDILAAAEATLAVQIQNKEKADQVITLIRAIGDVTIGSAEQIAAARAAYEALTEQQRALIPAQILTKLTEAEKTLEALQEQQERIQKFRDSVDKIPETLSLENDSQQLVAEAYAAYQDLTEEERSLIEPELYQKVQSAREELNRLAEEAMQEADFEAANAIMQRIGAASGEVTLEKEETIRAIREDYEKLTEVQKALVENYYNLVKLENDLAALKEDIKAAEQFDDRLSQIGEVTLESEELLAELRSAYNALSAPRKALVKNLGLLTDAEGRLRYLKEDFGRAQEVMEKIRAIGSVTLESRMDIVQARTAYDTLLDRQKQYIDTETLQLLTDAEKEYARLESLMLQAISLNEEQVTLNRGETLALTVTYQPEDTVSDRTVTWSSADEKVVTVKDGLLTAQGGGETVVTARVGVLTAFCTVKVEVPLTGLQAGTEKLVLKQGTTSLLSVKPLPEDTTGETKLSYGSDHPEIVSVDPSGKLTANAPGTAVITIKSTAHPEIFTLVNVQVTGESSSIAPEPPVTVKIVRVSGLKLSKKKNSRSVALKWKKVKKASGYEVYRSIGNKKKWKRAAVLKKSAKITWKQKNMKKGKRYFYKVRAYRVVNGKKYYGTFSKVKTVK